MKDWVLLNWDKILLICVGIGVVLFALFSIPKKWLLFAVTQAETELGNGTGRLKLLYVYNLYVTKFPIIGKFMPFTLFEKMVDWVLLEMRKMLEENKEIAEIVETREKI